MRRLDSRQHGHAVPPPGGLTRLARLLLVAVPFLLALSAPARLEAQKDGEKKQAQSVPCPNITLCCHASLKQGRLGPFIATLGETKGVRPTFDWKLSAGRVAAGAGTNEIVVDTKGLKKGAAVLATVEVGGFGPRCSATCLVTPALPDDPVRPATLDVTVLSSQGNRPTRARLNIYRADGSPGVRDETDARGRYRRDGWAPGAYHVEATADGFETQVSDVLLAAASAGSVAISLKPLGVTPPTPTPSPRPSPTPSPAPSPTPSPEPSPSPTATPSDGALGPLTTPTPAATPTPTPRSKTLIAGLTDGTGLPWLVLAAIAALAAAGYLLSQKLAAGAAGAAETVAGAAEQSPGAAAGATQQSDEVHCTVFSPPQVAPGDTFQVQVFAHLAGQRERLAAEALKADDRTSERKGAALSGAVRRETDLTFKLQVIGLEVLEPVLTLRWRGPVEPPECVQFVVSVPEDCKPKSTSGVVKIFYEGAQVGQVVFQVRVAAAGAAEPAAPAPPPQKEIRYKKAFISYCSKDRAHVLQELQGLETAYNRFGVACFMDVDGIHTGEEWREVIEKNLDESDLFVLFWSSAARDSKEVLREVEYALARKGGREDSPPYFDPIPIELPIPMPLPKGLEPIHFNDRKLLMLKGQQAVDAEVAARAARPEAAGRA